MAEHQIVQTGTHNFLIRAVPLKGQSIDAARVRHLVMDQIVAEGLDGLVDVDIEIVPEIPRGPSGKIARVKNEYAKRKAARETATV